MSKMHAQILINDNTVAVSEISHLNKNSVVQQVHNNTMQGKNVSLRNNNYNSCLRCGRFHPRYKCPARGVTCSKCRGRNHFAQVCRKQVNLVVNGEDDPDDSGDLFIGSLNQDNGKLWYVHLIVNRNCTILETLEVGDSVIFKKDPKSNVWNSGKIVRIGPEPRSYIIKDNIGMYRRNRKVIKKSSNSPFIHNSDDNYYIIKEPEAQNPDLMLHDEVIPVNNTDNNVNVPVIPQNIVKEPIIPLPGPSSVSRYGHVYKKPDRLVY